MSQALRDPRAAIRRPSAPERAPKGVAETQLEVVSAASPKARPKLLIGAIGVLGAAGILAAQLGLSMVMTSGAYEIETLQSTQRELDRTATALNEQLLVTSSTQNLAQSASALGMVPNTRLEFLDVQSGQILGGGDESRANPLLSATSTLVTNSALEAIVGGQTIAPPAPEVTPPPATPVPQSTGINVPEFN